MIKIKKHGNMDLIPKYKMICPRCGCEFTCNDSDVKDITLFDREPAIGFINCPDCNKVIPVERNLY